MTLICPAHRASVPYRESETSAAAAMTNATLKRIHLTQPSPACRRVTFDHPPLSIFGPEAVSQFNEIISAFEVLLEG